MGHDVEEEEKKAEEEEEDEEGRQRRRAPQSTLEETPAEACQLGLESDWQGDVAERLQQVDAEQERESERLAQLHRQTLADSRDWLTPREMWQEGR
ncbi:unnamed protein product [Pleuronectes platessa]|uniref:Uncharacterized protein n=1 Tax=Pleuronectes platessa TaxID=8262 RepID=A0A9N7TZ23_PLEPL|nr:unnamed protein product [Pleuronectes platessa]